MAEPTVIDKWFGGAPRALVAAVVALILAFIIAAFTGASWLVGLALAILLFVIVGLILGEDVAAPAAVAAPATQPAAKPPAAAVPAASPAAMPKAAASAPVKPAALAAPREAGADDLKRIKGVGPKLEALLHSLGVYHFDQIANWTEAEIAWVDEHLEGFHGRATRDDWIGQSKILAAGGETEHSQRVDRGEST